VANMANPTICATVNNTLSGTIDETLRGTVPGTGSKILKISDNSKKNKKICQFYPFLIF